MSSPFGSTSGSSSGDAFNVVSRLSVSPVTAAGATLAENSTPPAAVTGETDNLETTLNASPEDEPEVLPNGEDIQDNASSSAAVTNAEVREQEPEARPPARTLTRPSGTTNTTPPVNPPAEELKGNIKIVVRPYGDIYINNVQKAKGSNAALNDALAPGIYTIRAAHPALGSWEKRVEVKSGGAHEVLFNFNQPITVTVVSNPRAAEIIVDGKPTGKYTPSNIVIPPGNHTFEVRKDGFVMEGRAKSLLIERELDDPIQFKLNP